MSRFRRFLAPLAALRAAGPLRSGLRVEPLGSALRAGSLRSALRAGGLLPPGRCEPSLLAPALLAPRVLGPRLLARGLLARRLLAPGPIAAGLLAAGLLIPAAAQAGEPALGAFLRAEFAFSQNDLPVAAAGFLEALAADPGNAALRRETFIACLLDGRPEAVRLAGQLSDNPAARLVLADQQARQGRWPAAQALYAGLPPDGVGGVLEPLLVAWSQQAQGRTDAALATLQPDFDRPGLGGIYVLHAAAIADLAHRDDLAARLYLQAETSLPGLNLRLAQMLASFAARHGHPEDGRATIRRATAGHIELAAVAPRLEAAVAEPVIATPADGIAEAYLALAASTRQQQGEFALLLLQLALEMRPDFPAARLLMADISADSGHLRAALREIAPVPADDPFAPVVQLRRAALEAQLGQNDVAAHQLGDIIKQYPGWPEPMIQLGALLHAEKHYAEAASAFEQGLAEMPHPGPESWPVYFELGTTLDQAGKWQQAEAALEQALRLSPDQPAVLNYLGYSWAQRGEHLDQAQDMIQKAVDLRPNDGAILDSLGWVLLVKGDAAGAIRWLERAVELDPEDPTINTHLGDAYWAVGRRTEAENQWRLALVLHPEQADLVKIRAKLRDVATGGDPTAPQLRVQ